MPDVYITPDAPCGLVDESDIADALRMPVRMTRIYLESVGALPVGQYRGRSLWPSGVIVSLLDARESA